MLLKFVFATNHDPGARLQVIELRVGDIVVPDTWIDCRSKYEYGDGGFHEDS